jgi:hypothetical protein
MKQKSFAYSVWFVCGLVLSLFASPKNIEAQGCNLKLTIHISHTEQHGAGQEVIFALQKEQQQFTKKNVPIPLKEFDYIETQQ